MTNGDLAGSGGRRLAGGLCIDCRFMVAVVGSTRDGRVSSPFAQRDSLNKLCASC
jgi:hypothetical protein